MCANLRFLLVFSCNNPFLSSCAHSSVYCVCVSVCSTRFHYLLCCASGGARPFFFSRSLLRSRRRHKRQLLSPCSLVGPSTGVLVAAVVSNRLSTTCMVHSTQGGKRHNSPRLFTTENGMATYIQWWRIPERSHQIHKVIVVYWIPVNCI